MRVRASLAREKNKPGLIVSSMQLQKDGYCKFATESVGGREEKGVDLLSDHQLLQVRYKADPPGAAIA